MVDPHGRPEHVLDGLAQHLPGVGPGPRHRLVQQPGQLLGPGPARRRPVPQPVQGVHHQLDDLVAELPHLVGGRVSGEWEAQRPWTVLFAGRVPGLIPVATPVPPPSYAEADVPRRRSNAAMDQDRRPENLLGVVLDAYWTSLDHDPLSTLLLTALLSLGGVLVVLLAHILGDLAGQLAQLLS
jgi:hypothetical protein